LETVQQFWVKDNLLELKEVFVSPVKPRKVLIMVFFKMLAFPSKPFMVIAHMMQ
jgi:hypothetical protein